MTTSYMVRPVADWPATLTVMRPSLRAAMSESVQPMA